MRKLFIALALSLLTSVSGQAASLSGDATIQIDDPSGGLSWVPANNAHSVLLWMRLSIPSGTNITDNMTVLVDRQDGDDEDHYAFWIRLNPYSGNLEFLTRGDSDVTGQTLIEKPYLERWYHLAVVRDGTGLSGYVDGRQVFTAGASVGDASNTNGVSIGGWGDEQRFFGDIQEVAIYQRAVSQEFIVDNMFSEQPDIADLKGYYKLGYSTNAADHLRNFASNAPTNTDPATVSGGTVEFEEVDEAGEQSAFDSKRNGGRDAITPLSGAFSWEQSVLARATPGVAFDFRIGYSSANSHGGFKLGGYDPFESSVLGKGWRHSFQTRLLPSQYFSPVADLDSIGLMLWNGSVETWDLTNSTYTTRHKEYRGELTPGPGFPPSTVTWTTPDRLIYTFRSPFSGATLMRGRLTSIHDSNSNAVHVLWDESIGIVTQVVDTAGGTYDFTYNPQGLLTNVSFEGWSVAFEHSASNQLIAKTLRGPAEHTTVNTRWEFTYGASNELLQTISDPLSNAVVTVSYDDYGRVEKQEDALGRETFTAYGVPGKRQITRTDPDGKKWIETYDRKHHILEQEDPLGNATAYTYDEHGNRTSITEPLGWRTTFAYDDRANVVASTNALGEVSRWDYHPFFNKVTNEVDALGWATGYELDAAGNMLRQFDDLGTLVSYTYLSNGLVDASTDANGHTTRFAYTPDGFLASRTDPASNTWRYARNELGWQTAVTNPLNQVSTYEYDLNGNQTRRVDPLLREFTQTYDANGKLLSESDAKGRLTHYRYDAANQKTQMVDRAGAAWSYTYTQRGEIETITDPLTNTVTKVYDDSNRLIRETDPYGNSIQYAYDGNGNLVVTTDKMGKVWRKTYDRLNRVIAETDPLGNTTRTTYDRVGRVETLTSPKGYTSTHEYDGRGRLQKWTDAEGYDWLYDYDGVGNITNITDALGGHYVMSYGTRNERLSERNQDDFLWTYTYDELLRLQQQVEPNGTVRTMQYDNGGRLETVTFNTGRINTIAYDDNDNPEVLVRTGSGPATISQLEYDEMDRVREYTDTFGKKVQYAYDSRGRVKTLTYPGNKDLAHEYDKLGRLIRQTDWDGRHMAYTYDKLGRLKTRTYPNGITQTNAFDEAGRLTGLVYDKGDPDPLIALRYAYDRNGNKTSAHEKGTLPWTPPTRYDEHADYTASGRLIDRVDAADTNRTFAYSYDASGNMTNAVGFGQSYAFTYDEDNRVMSVHWDTGLSSKDIGNRYDSLGRRISRTIDGVETRYVLHLAGDMERILCDMTTAGSITAYYIHGPDLCYKVDATNGVTCYHADAMGNIIATTDGSKQTVSQYAYNSYGRLLGIVGDTSDPYRFVGSQGVMEELPNLYFMRARYYSGEAGVFLSTDPIKRIGPGWKPVAYAYAQGNPLTYNDPEGEFINLVAGAVGGAAIGAGLDLFAQVIIEGKSFEEINWNRTAGAAVSGAVVGTIASTGVGAAMLANPAGAAAIGGLSSGISTVTENALSGNDITEGLVENVAAGAVVGGVMSFIPSRINISNKGAKNLVYSGKTRGRLPSTLKGWLNPGSSHVRNRLLVQPAYERARSQFSSTLKQTVKTAVGDVVASSGESGGSSGGSSGLSSRAPFAGSYALGLNSSQSTCCVVPSSQSGSSSSSSSASSGNDFFSGVANGVGSALQNAGNAVSQAVQSAAQTVSQAVSGAVNAVGGFFSSLFGGG